ncbi:TPA: hypothetical protein ACP5VL_000436 [Vibrio parahaemolyticus]|uniref:hypothetical protein n=1 Tax=Vibrio parahaemolyticus TaxID=670 RepID=UPI000A3B0CAA|nr:hypothetical protein [Vibrio parahaemolyticus]MCG9643190.1 hypothetical protein [Vibrio parahaemolyticus]OUD47596.1 hypothetical protein BS624_04125 [Vibrio parahaemolyticus]
MSLEAFKNKIRDSDPETLAEEWFFKDSVHSIKDSNDYGSFKGLIKNDYSDATDIAIMGSGNWGFSLNPDKAFRAFHEHSDIDVAIISPKDFELIWEDIRVYHRKKYYSISYKNKQSLLRNGQNVYSGFVSPKWNPNRKSQHRYNYEINTHNYSNQLVDFKKVNMMFFKSLNEVVDYYVRSIRLAKGNL